MIANWTFLLLFAHCHWSFIVAAKPDVLPEEVSVLVNESFSVTCTVPGRYAGYNASQLYFLLGGPDADSPDPSRTSLVDSRTIAFTVNRAGLEYDNGHAHCYLRTEAGKSVWVGASTIHVGQKPGLIRDFQCVSPNWSSMLCTWNCSRVPGHGGVGDHFIRYSLNYTIHSRKNEGPAKACKLSAYSTELCLCHFTVDSQNAIFSKTNYGIVVEARGSSSGIIVQVIERSVDNVKIVRPDPVENLAVNESTDTTLTVEWKNPTALEHNIRALNYQLRYHSDFGTEVVDVDCANYCTYVLRSLLPYTNYTISVRSITKEYPSYWSAWQVATGRTSQSVPVRGPEMSAGAFTTAIWDETVLSTGASTRDIDLYFKDVPHEYLRGALVDMRVNVSQIGSLANIAFSCANTMRLRYCKIPKLDCWKEYLVSLEPKTSMGFNRYGAASSIRLTTCGRGPPSVDHFVGEIFESDAVESTISFTWKPTFQPTNLTLYFCSSTNCEEGLQWRDVPVGHTSYNLTVLHEKRSINDYKFSISSHNASGSRGMASWMTCLYDFDGEPGLPTLRPGVEELQSSESAVVEIIAPECQKGSGRVLGYRLHYAPASSVESDNVTIQLDPYVTSYKLTDLRSNTKYQVSLTALGRNGEKQVIATEVTTAPPPPIKPAVVVVIVIVCLAVFLFVAILLCRLYRHLRETPIEIKLPKSDTERETGDRPNADEEFLHHLICETSLQFRDDSDYDVKDDTQRKLLPNGSLAENGAVKQRSRDSGNGSLLSDANNHDHTTAGDPGLAVVREVPMPQFIQGPDDYVLEVNIPTAYENRHYSANVPLQGEVSPLSSEPVSPGSDSMASNEASSSQDSDQKVEIKEKKNTDSESDSYWQVGVKLPSDDGSITIPMGDLDDNGNRTPVQHVTRDSRDNGYGSTTPNDASLTNCDDSDDTGSQYSLDSGHSLHSERTSFPRGPMVMNGDYVIRPDSLEPKRPVNSCGETSEDTDNSETGQDSYAKVGLSPEAIDSRVLGLTESPTKTETTVIPLETKKDKPFKPVTLDPTTALA